MSNIALVLAGGNSVRVNDSIPKQFLKLCGQPVIMYCLIALKDSGVIDKIVLAITRELEEWYDRHHHIPLKKVLSGYVDEYSYDIKETRVGTELSYIASGILDSGENIVLVHDAVRPFLDIDLVKSGIAKATQHKSCIIILGEHIPDSLVRITETGAVIGAESREFVVKTQTPIFYRGLAVGKGARAALGAWAAEYETRGGISWVFNSINEIPIFAISASPTNIKITYDHDLIIAERIHEYTNSAWLDPIITGAENILLIGSRGGIGFEIKRQLLETRCSVICMDRPEFDATDPRCFNNQDLYRMYDACIYTPGILYGTREDVYRVNLFTPQTLIEKARFIVKGNGSFLVFGSSSAYRGRDDVPFDYSGSKAALINYVESIGPYLYNSCGVHLNCLCPRKTKTPILDGIRYDRSLDVSDIAAQAIKMALAVGRVGEVYNMR